MTLVPAEAPLVEVADLGISFGEVRAVDSLSFTLRPGAALGVVGESGSGKSASAYALLGLHRGTGARVTGAIRVAGVDVMAASDAELRSLRGGLAAMVFQDPLSSLDPYYTIGDQIAEVYRVHKGGSRRAARARAVSVLDRVGIPDAARKSRSRPHEFSGGMRQRALIAMALACEPRLLIADEPTTALDVTVQAQILDLLHDLRRETGLGLVLVTHDVGVAAESVDEVLVMRAGRAVERGPVGAVLGAPREPYTRALLSAVPRISPTPPLPKTLRGSAPGCDPADTAGAPPQTPFAPEGRSSSNAGRAGDAGEGGARSASAGPAGDAAEGGSRTASGPQGGHAAVSGPARGAGNCAIGHARSAVVGGPSEPQPLSASPAFEERGSANGPRPHAHPRRVAGRGGVGETSTEGGLVLQASDLRHTFGRGRAAFTAVDGVSLKVHRGETLGIVGESGSGKTTLGRMLVGLLEPSEGTVTRTGDVQMVFQDPVSSLNPRRSIGESVADPLRARGERDDSRIRTRVGELLRRVGLDPDRYDSYPHEFSGGQRQRVGIARALAAEPTLIVCDEPVSALDVTTQAQVTALLGQLQRELGLALVFVAHDLAVVRQVSDRVAVMRQGRIVEEGEVDVVYGAPKDPYTRQLLAAVPSLDPALAATRRAARRELREASRETAREEVAVA
ncbi:ABC transporter ATP-binding protein [Streptomyces sp. WM6378]|uniref:ABC transporter ATP-binding protein n=1 Tax=Streptomyces sp. WM6378 TaxID=1415557 RepID=UPI0006AEF69B|nr:ABC transporter ATP-binding protein [Streptomyces sp. WM6378]KOU35806.1 ABC transporter ATP-binding protein [Streptomyces sp. WM6378]